MPIYLKPGLVASKAGDVDVEVVRAFQADLRKLGYLHSGVDGAFGPGTKSAIRAFQYDLMNNQGASSNGDGAAPVAVASFNVSTNGALVQGVTGIFDQSVANCLANMIADDRVPKLPESDDPNAANKQAMEAIMANVSQVCPTIFVAAIAFQESGGKHYAVPTGADLDRAITVGLDRNGPSMDCITSRGYGLGQYTLFHHPPRPEEVAGVMVDPIKNVEMACSELRLKLDKYIVGPTDQSDDRISEIGSGPVRLCKFPSNDNRYMTDCASCIKNLNRIDIDGTTFWYPGSTEKYVPTSYHPNTHYTGVPDRAHIGCDWPYAVRRYNGGGINSYHYQAEVMLILLNLAEEINGQ